MANTIASLAVNVVANTAPFARGMKAARAEAKLLEASVSSLKGIMGGFGAAIAAGFTIHGLKSTAEEMDRITKSAKRLGISTEAVSALDYAAQRSGTSFESLAKAIQMMERNVASGLANQYLKDLGLDAEQLKRLAPDQQLLAIADKISNLGDASRRTNDLMGIFGRSGADLGNLLMEGADGIQALMDRAKELGLTFDEEMGKKAEEANDALLNLEASLKGLGRTLVSEFGPALASTADGLANLISAKDAAMTGGANELKGNFFDTMLGGMSDKDFQKFYQQVGNARREKGGLSDLLIGQYGVKRDQVNVDALDSAITRRSDKITADIQAKQQEAGLTSGIGPSGNMLGAQSLWMMNFGMAAMSKFPGTFAAPDLDPAEMHRITNAVAEMTASNDAATPAAGGRQRLAAALGTFGQEGGSAEAFRQERRTAMAAGGHDIQAKQLEEQKKQTTALHKIDTNTSKSEALEVINIA